MPPTDPPNSAGSNGRRSAKRPRKPAGKPDRSSGNWTPGWVPPPAAVSRLRAKAYSSRTAPGQTAGGGPFILKNSIFVIGANALRDGKSGPARPVFPCSRRVGQSPSPTAWDLRAVMPRIGAPSSRLPAAQNALYRGKQLGHINGLAQMAVHSSGKDDLPVLLKGVGRHGHNGQAGQLRVV